MVETPKKRCCRSTPRCASCPVVLALRARPAGAGTGGLGSLFDEIYGGQPRPLPACVSDALASLALARQPRQRTRDQPVAAA